MPVSTLTAHARHAPAPLSPAPLARERIDPAAEPDRQAWRAWSAQVAAGRIGARPLAPPPPEARLASLEAILATAASAASTGRPA